MKGLTEKISYGPRAELNVGAWKSRVKKGKVWVHAGGLMSWGGGKGGKRQLS